MRARLACGVALLMACGGYSGPSAEERAARARPQVTEGVGDVAGGETSEFTGGIDPCSKIVSSEPIDLEVEDPELASWAAMAQGHHEQTLGWRRLVLSDEVVGFEEHTTVSIDVNVLGGRENVYGNVYGSTEDGFIDCEGRRGREIGLEIRLATADGAYASTWRNWFTPGPTASRGTVLSMNGANVHDMGDGLNGTLELGFDPALGGTPRMRVEIEFSAEFVRGRLAPEVLPEDGAGNGAPWWPIEGLFPDDPCVSLGSDGVTIGLDEYSSAIGGTPRAIYRRMATARAGQRLGAVWRSMPSNVQPSPSDVPVDVPPPTEVSLSAGEPTRACDQTTSVTVYGPLTVTTADGLVNFTQPFGFNLVADSYYVGELTPWVPAADFNANAGLGGVHLDSGYGTIYLQSFVNWQNRWVEGALEVQQWDAFTHERAAYPVLEWCNYGQCAPATP